MHKNVGRTASGGGSGNGLCPTLWLGCIPPIKGEGSSAWCVDSQVEADLPTHEVVVVVVVALGVVAAVVAAAAAVNGAVAVRVVGAVGVCQTKRRWG